MNAELPILHIGRPQIGVDAEDGIAVENAIPGEYVVRYKSGIDLLAKTPKFYQQVSRERLQRKFNRAYRYIEVLYSGENPYVDAMKNNIVHLVRVLQTGDWKLLRRSPPYFVGVRSAIQDIEKLARSYLERVPKGAPVTEDLVTA